MEMIGHETVCIEKKILIPDGLFEDGKNQLNSVSIGKVTLSSMSGNGYQIGVCTQIIEMP